MAEQNEVQEAINANFITKEKFAEDIEYLVLRTKMNYIDAIITYCEERGLDVESIAKLMSKPLKEKLRYDATELNYLKRTSRAKLPF